MTTEAQKRASAKYHAHKMSDPEYREKWNKRFVAITIKNIKMTKHSRQKVRVSILEILL